jgi:hypothetical protein
MDLVLVRDVFNEVCTLGVLNNSFQTLELPRKDGLPGSCIPVGTYRVTTAFSPHFQRIMPLILGIPNRSEIEIHWGNYPDDTRGCILLGTERGDNSVLNSRAAFDELFPMIQQSSANEGCWITISERE